ncbi:uncharacterized protein LOC135385215 [Ornithodoros turicata]|uniref:uncharacterized protein LOC135385215 n=1 Tax=Ornithodoros turicata TaxID=34597 RepID=UPI003139D4AB
MLSLLYPLSVFKAEAESAVEATAGHGDKRSRTRRTDTIKTMQSEDISKLFRLTIFVLRPVCRSRAKMRFALIIATLLAGVLAVDVDNVALPDFHLSVFGIQTREVNFTHGKVQGLSKFFRSARVCYGRYSCVVSVSGLRFTYKAAATLPEQEFDVVVDVLHGLLEVDLARNTDDKDVVKDVRVKSLNQYVRKPVLFSSDWKQSVLFDEKLKEKTHEFLKRLTRTEAFE